MARANDYGQFCPVALASQVLAERWTPLVVRELLMGSVRFNDLLRGLPRISPSLLSQRLRGLEAAGVVERRRGAAGPSEYHLTAAGRDLHPIVEAMGGWAQRWLRDALTAPVNLDADLLMWDIRRRVAVGVLDPQRRFVTEFRFSGVPAARRRYWLVSERGEVDLCYKDPGFEVDLLVETDLRRLTEVWLGHVPLRTAVDEGAVRLEGSRRDVAAFHAWFALSPMAPAGAAPPGERTLARV